MGQLAGETGTMMPDEFFARLVADDVKNRVTAQQRKELMLEENWDRWKRGLLSLLDNLEDQIENIQIDAQADAVRYEGMGRAGKRLADEAARAYDMRETKVQRFRLHVERRLSQVESMLKTGQPIDENPWETVEFYRRAIIMHRNMLNDYDLEDTAIDRALWATLDNRWDFDRVDPLSL
ncbi:MAG: hypothetical protein QF577_00080 [Phycisphaerae bacterium]|mgnify:FL=1|jgi:hypothetical protein|nr:hypothetical protein [Phycisphaerae bacterium]|tara:strand:- start:4104 stop:4640 length:537 start_codon:yes stop_codon:yes gene_type:complete